MMLIYNKMMGVIIKKKVESMTITNLDTNIKITIEKVYILISLILI